MDATANSTQSTLSTATSTLALIAGAISITSGFAYVIAYRYLTGFFHAIGCDWAINLYEPTQIIQTAAPVAVAAAGLAFAIWNIYTGSFEHQLNVKDIAAGFIAAAALYGIHLLIVKFATSYKSYFIWAAAFVAFTTGTAAIANIVQKVLATQGVAWGSLVLVVLAAYCLFVLSYDRGKSHAEETISMKDGRGSPVEMNGTTDPYRLARIVPYDRALVFTETSAGKRIFRVVSITEIRFESTKRRI